MISIKLVMLDEDLTIKLIDNNGAKELPSFEIESQQQFRASLKSYLKQFNLNDECVSTLLLGELTENGQSVLVYLISKDTLLEDTQDYKLVAFTETQSIDFFEAQKEPGLSHLRHYLAVCQGYVLATSLLSSNSAPLP